ncbi:MAG TPA: Dam family site-specific DNA-(adenine-N6)-methyltransferase [Terriglobales bacterium]|nr:Dam family site-specific DNA-(adenine-N6)-methyltransferase [Terriglobales bacterium]
MTRKPATPAGTAKQTGPAPSVDRAGEPFLRWAGSKRKLIPALRQYCPPKFGRYFEPFAGSACLYFSLAPKRAVLGDFNKHLIGVYRAVRRDPAAVHRRLARYPKTQEFYYRLRSSPPLGIGNAEAAARFIYLNRYCFNGVYRTNRDGYFNVPRGTRTGSLPTKVALASCSSVLRRAKLVSGDFEATIADADKGDFVYLDPPYSTHEARERGEYGYGGFSSTDVERLARALATLDAKGAIFLMSYASTAEIKKTLRRWHQRPVAVRRHVAGFAKHRHQVTELLVSNRQLGAAHK